MSKVTFDYSKAAQFINDHEVEYMKKLTLDAKEVLVNKTGAGNDFLGWIDLPVDYDKEEFARIKLEKTTGAPHPPSFGSHQAQNRSLLYA